MVVDLFLSRAALEAEILTLRQQINVLRRTAPKKQTFSSIDRLIFVCLYRLLPGVRDALAIAKLYNPHTSSHGLAGVELTKLPLNALTSNQSNCNAKQELLSYIIGSVMLAATASRSSAVARRSLRSKIPKPIREHWIMRQQVPEV